MKVLNRAICRIAGLLLAGTALSTPHFAWAQTPAATPAQTPPAAQSDDTVVVVTARKRTERLIDVPVAASVAGPAEIRKYNLTSVANIKIVAPQITLDRGFTGAGASISMRGVSSSSLDAGLEQSVLLDFDGMAISRGRIISDGLFDLQGIEVLKGPQALFFGKNSPGGVVSIKSADPTKTFQAFVRSGYEFTARNPSVEAAVSGPISDKLGFRVAVLASSSQGYIKNQDIGVTDLVRGPAAGGTGMVPAGQSRLGAENKLDARVTLKYDNGDNFNANFKLLVAHYDGQSLQSFDEVMGCPAGKTHPTVGAGIVDPYGDCKLDDKTSYGWLSPTIVNAWPQVKKYDNGHPYSKDDTVLPTLTMNYKVGDITLTSVTGYYDYDYVSQGDADGTAYSYFWSYSDEKNRSLYQEFRAVSSFDGMINFAMGGHLEHNDRTLYVGGANGPVAMDPTTGKYNSYDNSQHNTSDAYSLFGQLLVKFAPNFEFAGGGRFTHESKKLDTVNYFVNANAVGFLPQGQHITGSKSEENFSPEATLSWHPSKNVLVYGAYKTGYLAGGFSNPGTISSVSSIKTLSFNEEKVKGEELGIKAGSLFDRKLTGSITAYSYTYTGLPLTSLIALDATHVTFVTQNAANTITRGVELEGSYRPTTSLTFNGSVTYNHAYFDDFAKAQCYTGQTGNGVATGQAGAMGCTVDAITGAKTQNLTGKVVYRSPEWLVGGGFVYETTLSSGAHFDINGDFRYSDAYYAGLNLNPSSYQKGFTLINAGARLSTSDDKWSLALIGRNLTNRRYGTLGVDKPGGTGEVFTVAGEPRSIVLQVEAKF